MLPVLSLCQFIIFYIQAAIFIALAGYFRKEGYWDFQTAPRILFPKFCMKLKWRREKERQPYNFWTKYCGRKRRGNSQKILCYVNYVYIRLVLFFAHTLVREFNYCASYRSRGIQIFRIPRLYIYL